uniref:Uncharacterized protein n=1 Tax=Anguilla anguilla TaxID=7936 RepID=A0A0E9ULG2_ANGAN
MKTGIQSQIRASQSFPAHPG